MVLSLREKLDRHTRKGDGCWEWTAALNQKGYGLLKHDGIQRAAHRWSYRENIGPVPKHLVVMHSCDNPRCLRPDHLVLGTHKDNAQDRERKGRGGAAKRRGTKNCECRLTEAQVLEIFGAAGKTSTGELATQYGISRTMIHYIQTGHKWGWLTQGAT